jgi:hypothetical protein
LLGFQEAQSHFFSGTPEWHDKQLSHFFHDFQPQNLQNHFSLAFTYHLEILFGNPQVLDITNFNAVDTRNQHQQGAERFRPLASTLVFPRITALDSYEITGFHLQPPTAILQKE